MFSNTNQQRLGCQICIQCILQNKESKFTFEIECRNHNCTNVPQTSISHVSTHIHPFTHPFNGPLSGTTQVSRYQKGKTNLDFTEARDSEWQWNPLAPRSGQITTPAPHCSVFLQAGCPSCCPTNSVKALKVIC